MEFGSPFALVLRGMITNPDGRKSTKAYSSEDVSNDDFTVHRKQQAEDLCRNRVDDVQIVCRDGEALWMDQVV